MTRPLVNPQGQSSPTWSVIDQFHINSAMRISEIISNADTTARRDQARQLCFTFVGWRDGWYVLLLRTEGHLTIDIHAFRERVLQWLIEQDMSSHLTDSNAVNAFTRPTADDHLWLLLRRASDVLRFEREFGARGTTPKSITAALRAEASSHNHRT
jgi:hypothetical protein